MKSYNSSRSVIFKLLSEISSLLKSNDKLLFRLWYNEGLIWNQLSPTGFCTGI